MTGRPLIAIALVLTLVGCGGGAAASSNELAPAPDYSGHPAIDSIPCETVERVVYHVHAHLALFVDGQQRAVPYGIGIAAPRQTQQSEEGPFVASGGCFYWLHTHTADGVIHIEAPVQMDFRLGHFFDVWQQPLTTQQVAQATGTVTAYVNGQPYSGDPRQVPLVAHALIQLDVGRDVAPQPFTFPAGL